MLDDFRMITHSFPDSINVVPIADVHLGAIECAEKEWQTFLQGVLNTPDTYLIIAGDMLNNTTRGVRFANPFDERYRPREAKRLLTQYLEPVKDRILCVVPGNHEYRTVRESDQDLLYDVCCRLDIEHLFRENMAFMRIGLGQRPAENKAQTTYTFAVMHGTGGGMTGAAVNRNEKFAGLIDGLDCFVAAHVHKGFVTKPDKIVIDARNGVVKTRNVVVISCVSWLNYGGYAARAMLPPSLTADPQMLRLTQGNSGKNKKIITTW